MVKAPHRRTRLSIHRRSPASFGPVSSENGAILTNELGSLNADVPDRIAVEAFTADGAPKFSRVVPVRSSASRP